eukprot:4455837-Amphidinium_carterae.3
MYGKQWQCPVCQERRAPHFPSSTQASTRPSAFGQHVAIDIKYFQTVDERLHCFLSMVDLSSKYLMACLLKTRESAYIARKGASLNFAGLFVRMLEDAAIPSRVSGILGHMLRAVLYNTNVKEWADIKVALAATVQAKNA